MRFSLQAIAGPRAANQYTWVNERCRAATIPKLLALHSSRFVPRRIKKPSSLFVCSFARDASGAAVEVDDVLGNKSALAVAQASRPSWLAICQIGYGAK
jgi:hypothetical protein